MAKIRLTGPVVGISGSMDEMVFVDRDGQTIAYMKKKKKKGEKSEAELRRDDRWAVAQAYAKSVQADPVKWELYETVAKEKKISPFILAENDYRNAPSFRPLDLQMYRGRVGDPITILAKDDVGLVSVEVKIEKGDGTDVESGVAVESGVRTDIWVYTATQAIPEGTDIFIEVVGWDHTGHRVKMTENPTVGLFD
jgi:hypothetical protein